MIDGDHWYKDDQHPYCEDRIVVPEAQMDGYLQWANLNSGHTGWNRAADVFTECSYSRLSCVEIRLGM